MHCIFFGIVKRLLKLMFKLTPKHKFSLKMFKSILNSRIKLFKNNVKMKRRMRSFDHLANFNATEYFNFFFYVSPLILKGLLDEQSYGFLMVLTYCISSFWSGCKRDDIDFIHNLIKLFLEDLEKHFSEREFTLNSHLLIHLKRHFLYYGPFKFSNSFIFEISNKYKCNDLIKSPFLMCKQVINQYNELFF